MLLFQIRAPALFLYVGVLFLTVTFIEILLKLLKLSCFITCPRKKVPHCEDCFQ